MRPLMELLAQNSFFAQFNGSEQAELARCAIFRKVDKREFVSRVGDVWPHLFLVTGGTLNLLRESAEGRSLIVTTLEAGQVFWGMAFFNENAPCLISIQARDASTIFVWHRDHLLPRLRANGSAAWELSRLLVSRMERASEILGELAFQPVAGRLARLLLDQSAGAADTRFTRNLTLDEMAARTGTTREVVCKTLYRFADKGLIHITRTEFTLIDQDGLNQLAQAP